MHLTIRKMSNGRFSIYELKNGEKYVIGTTDTAESAEKICEDYAGTDWGWE